MVHRLACLLALLASPPALEAQARFIRGEVNGDREIDISDPVAILFHLFEGEFSPECLSAGDLNDDGLLDVTDVVNLLAFLFQEGGPPVSPYPECGEDPTPGEPGCEAHPACGSLDLDPEITEWIVLDTPTTWLHRPKRIALSGGAQNPALVREKWIYYDDMPYEQMTLGLVTKEE